MAVTVTVAGIGCRRGVTADEVLAAVAAVGAGRPLDALAALPRKRGEPALPEAARRLGVPLIFAVAVSGFATRSAASLAVTGAASASEAAALGAAGPGARLVAPRRIVGRVTCAIAVAEGP